MIQKPHGQDFAQHARAKAVTDAAEAMGGAAETAGRGFKTLGNWLLVAFAFSVVWLFMVGFMPGGMREDATLTSYVTCAAITYGAWWLVFRFRKGGRKGKGEPFIPQAPTRAQLAANYGRPVPRYGVPPRPLAMVRFDQLLLTVIALNLIHLILAFPALRKVVDTDPAFAQLGVSFELMFSWLVACFLFTVGLWFCASRLRSNGARWVLSMNCGAAMGGNIVQLFVEPIPGAVEITPMVRAIAWVGALLSMVAIWYAFRPEASAWFEAKRAPARLQ